MNSSRRGGGNTRNNASFYGRQVPKTNFVPGGQVNPQTPSNQAASRPQTAPSQQAPKPGTPSKPQQIVPKIEPPSPKVVIENVAVEKQPAQKDIEMTDDAEKKSWKKKVKLPNKEKVKRRNQRLSKLLQPKNALMILHELVQNPTFTVSEFERQFQAVVTVADTQHTGIGQSKNAAKNAAAEAALRHLIRTKKVSPMDDASENGSEKMDTYDANDSPEGTPLPWQQVASFALYKLFDSWKEPIPTKLFQEEPKKNSARKLPDNPSTVNPISLINQMFPQATFEDETMGTPSSLTFRVQLNVDGQFFEGIGPSKKAAKKEACYAACHKLLNIVYPPEEYKPAVI